MIFIVGIILGVSFSIFYDWNAERIESNRTLCSYRFVNELEDLAAILRSKNDS